MTTHTDNQQLNQAFLKDAQPSFDLWMQDPEFQKTYEEESLKMQIAESIRARRKFLKLTQAKLAERVKTDQKVISRIEQENVSVGVDLLQRIAHALSLRITFTLV